MKLTPGLGSLHNQLKLEMFYFIVKRLFMGPCHFLNFWKDKKKIFFSGK
jgi:hypothetical protein